MQNDILELYEYELNEDSLAEGSISNVYQAEQTGVEGFSKIVAIRIFHNEYSRSELFSRSFIDGAKLAADLIHENIVQVYHLGRTDDILYLVIEYVDGIHLDKFLKYFKENKIPLDPEYGTFIISRAARGLEYAHERKSLDGRSLGVVHRNITLKSIMINYDGVVKVTDFGIAKAFQLMEQRERDKITFHLKYMSPEQLRMETIDGRSDIFSLGIVYYELLTGQHPFEDIDNEEMKDFVEHRPITDPRDFRSDLPSDIAEIVMKMLERDIEKRMQTSHELAVSLEKYMYSKGYGPTNQKLGVYVKKYFKPEEYDPSMERE